MLDKPDDRIGKPDPNYTAVFGFVKRFDKSRGFGFVSVPDVSDDILLHLNTVRNFGADMVAAGSAIEFEFVQTGRGMRVSKIISLSQCQMLASAKTESIDDGPVGILEPVRVRWYDQSRGFGFVNRFNDKEDIFIGQHLIESYGFSNLSVDEALAVRIRQLDGRPRVYELGSW